MNSTSFDSRHSPYTASTVTALAHEAQNSRKPQELNLTSSPRFSFKAPTAEDFDKGSRLFTEQSAPNPVFSMLASLWSKVSRR